MQKQQLITIAHSPDSDDAFMFYALATGKIESDRYRFEIVREDIETLNHLAQKETYDVTALSFHAYTYVADKYVLTRSGASFAEKGYGPIVVGKRAHELTSSRTHEKKFPNVRSCAHELVSSFKIAIPGTLTTAALLLKMIAPDITTTVMPFDQILDTIASDKVNAGLLIHEGQLQYQEKGLHKILSVIDWWKDQAGTLPLPLGGNAIRKSLEQKTIADLAILIKKSIRFALDNPDSARRYALQFKRNLTDNEAKRYLSWYANKRSLDMGQDGQRAVQTLLDLAHERALVPKRVWAEFV